MAPDEQHRRTQSREKSARLLAEEGNDDSSGSESSGSRGPQNEGYISEMKLKNFRHKIYEELEEIRIMLDEGFAQPDGDEDYLRRKRRTNEFTARFSRNYLYQIERQMSEIKKVGSGGMKSKFILNQRMVAVHQLMLQAMQYYHTHIPNMIGFGATDKFDVLLGYINSTCIMCQGKDDNDYPNVDDIETKCKILQEMIREQTLSKRTAPTRTSLVSTPSKPKIQKNVPFGKNALESRLSMYSVPVTNKKSLAGWKKSASALAKQKFNVPSRYLNPKPKPEPVEVVEEPKKIVEKGSSTEVIRAAPHNTPVNEDEIKTMVEDDTGLESETREIRNKIQPLLQDLVQKIDKNKNKIGSLKDLDIIKDLKDVLNQIQNITQVKRTLSEVTAAGETEDEVNPCSINCFSPKKKEPIITVTGEKNAKLICIQDFTREEEEEEVEEEIMEEKEDVQKLSDRSEEKLEDVCEREDSPEVSPEVSPEAIPEEKTARKLQSLPKPTIMNIARYRLNLHNAHKNDNMYKKSAKIQPWMLIGKIADQMLDDLLTTVVEEIECNDVLELLLNSELQ